MIELLHGCCTDVLRTLPAASVQCAISSPPYYALRDYGILPTTWPEIAYAPLIGVPPVQVPAMECCMGLEDDPLSYIGHLVHVFRLVRDVLRDDGVLWLNLGDSYAQPSKWGGNKQHAGKNQHSLNGGYQRSRRRSSGYKDKDLYGIPARAVLALQADGWYLRCDVIWEKPSGMPENVDDRPTRSHEYLYLLSKSEDYYYDAAAIAEPSAQVDRPQRRRAEELADQAGLTDAHLAAIQAAGITDAGKARTTQTGAGCNSAEVLALASEAKAALGGYYREFIGSGMRNRRSVWRIPAGRYDGAHFATFPEGLVEPCVLASTAARACPTCGAAWRRVFAQTGHVNQRKPSQDPRFATQTKSTGWKPTKIATDEYQPGCRCEHNDGSGRCTVLDPFAGTATVGKVAERYGRDFVGVEANAAYIDLADQRVRNVQIDMEALL